MHQRTKPVARNLYVVVTPNFALKLDDAFDVALVWNPAFWTCFAGRPSWASVGSAPPRYPRHPCCHSWRKSVELGQSLTWRFALNPDCNAPSINETPQTHMTYGSGEVLCSAWKQVTVPSPLWPFRLVKDRLVEDILPPNREP